MEKFLWISSDVPNENFLSANINLHSEKYNAPFFGWPKRLALMLLLLMMIFKIFKRKILMIIIKGDGVRRVAHTKI